MADSLLGVCGAVHYCQGIAPSLSFCVLSLLKAAAQQGGGDVMHGLRARKSAFWCVAARTRAVHIRPPRFNASQ